MISLFQFQNGLSRSYRSSGGRKNTPMSTGGMRSKANAKLRAVCPVTGTSIPRLKDGDCLQNNLLALNGLRIEIKTSKQNRPPCKAQIEKQQKLPQKVGIRFAFGHLSPIEDLICLCFRVQQDPVGVREKIRQVARGFKSVMLHISGTFPKADESV